ncbi:MAG TPA: leucyl/phenylalanyl-tRNA--protein transferase [Gaiella sp.]|jgi:leucyl/phenylalanyl-tRNA--protein transferase
MGPVEPPPTPWQLEPPPDDHAEDVWALGADLQPGTVLAAYRLGLFPMPVGSQLAWFSPARRAVLPLDGFHVARSLRRSRRNFELRVDTAFADVVRGCADVSRPGGWIDASVTAAYTELHRLGWAHSVECWDDEGLAGGLYGLALGGLFAAESMFYRRRDASKVALWGLVETLQAAGDDGDERLLDVQWLTPHLASLGAVEISRAEYRRRLVAALRLPCPFTGAS